ncbi:MAG: type II toxin-antitoxin system HipA family toxin [Alphaproteobacteria bacterium]|jgi:serine/threonine-protein kinase HipA|nr:type II toxin-antitoxin system HipA family toxin [Alphaproteobacteria bacterium]MBT5389436.1 type II toxin-antitoxin system HipA family toxin [Alphaproteobacteria bacterium]MBT5540984.1 type II toxin-antitoxin system HipA family toxin [Alphaproteobacteria bacterium]MBT5654990.1 type II toxin-antitoxin system HipA family toxin [Alphaproteobacteria bacterium]
MRRILDVYLYDVYAGQLVQDDSGVLSYAYDLSYLAKSNPAISLSLPLRSEDYEGKIVKAFFSGMLPEELVRHRLARYLGVSEKNPFALLEVIGGECAGALSLYPEGQAPPEAKKDDVEILDDKKLKEILKLLKRQPLLAGDDGLRLSLAGAQDKIAVRIQSGKISLVRGSTPTTHILKPVISDIKDSVHNEFFCMQLSQLMGIETPNVNIRWLGETPYYLVERYDRTTDENGHITRLHQEDFCQALGIMPDIKYEREGGPNITQCREVLLKHSATPAADHMSFLKRIIFNYVIGNADTHGKNFSLLYKDIKPNLSPNYDLLCTSAYSELSTKMAMKIGGKYRPEDVFLRHWNQLVPDTMASRRNLEAQLKKVSQELVERAYTLKETLSSEGIKSSIFDDIGKTITKRAKHIRQLW